MGSSMRQVSTNQTQRNDHQAGQASAAQKASLPEATTMCIRNIPNNYTTQMILELLDTSGFRNEYDFIYMPHDFQRLPQLVNVGYFFINFCSHEIALRAWDQLAGFKDWAVDSNKVLRPAWATKTQGLRACIERYQNSPVIHQDIPVECKPMCVENSKLVPLTLSATYITETPSKRMPSECSNGNAIVELTAKPISEVSDASTDSGSEDSDQVSCSGSNLSEQVDASVDVASCPVGHSWNIRVKNTFLDSERSPSVERAVFRAVRSLPDLSLGTDSDTDLLD